MQTLPTIPHLDQAGQVDSPLGTDLKPVGRVWDIIAKSPQGRDWDHGALRTMARYGPWRATDHGVLRTCNSSFA